MVREMLGPVFRGRTSAKCLQISIILLQFFFLKQVHCSVTTNADDNPLLGKFTTLNFKVTAKDITDAMPQLLKEANEKFKGLEKKLDAKIKKKEPLTWRTVVEAKEDIMDRININWEILTLLRDLKEYNKGAFKAAVAKVQIDVVELRTKIEQSTTLYKAYEILRDNEATLDEAQQRILDSALKSAYHSGVSLKGKKKRELALELELIAKVESKCNQNVEESMKKISFTLMNKGDVEGLPQTLLETTAKEAAVSSGKTTWDPKIGPWRMTVNWNDYLPFMKFSKNRSLRERVYKAQRTIASSGEEDNTHLVDELRKLRRKSARMLRFQDYEHLSLDTKMAGGTKEVMTMIENLRKKSKPMAQNEIADLQDFAAKLGFKGKLRPWDFDFYRDQQREALYRVNETMMSNYFPLPKVLQGVMSLASELFDIEYKPADGDADVWDKDVRYFEIYDKKGPLLGSLYLDLYTRPNKKTYLSSMKYLISRNERLNRNPIACLITSLSPPTGEKPSLLSFSELKYMIHQFGHSLQHILTTVKYPAAAGMKNIEGDAAEMTGTFMEFWLYDWTTMQLISGHYKTGKNLPKKSFDQLTRARTYMAGYEMLEQMYYTALDFQLHTSTKAWPDVLKNLQKGYTVIKPWSGDKWPTAFTYIFEKGFAAGYYIYKWSEAMAADAFTAFSEVGLQNRKQVQAVGKRFRDTFLALGGGCDPKKVFVDFRGRSYKTEALLKMHGME